MRFPLTDALIREATEHDLRCACRDCFFYVAAADRCAHEWPNADQKRSPQDAAAGATAARTASFCKEFELR